MTGLIHNSYMGPRPIPISYHGNGDKNADGADPYHLRDSGAGRWVGISLPNLSLLRSHALGTGRDGTCDDTGTAPDSRYLRWVLDELSISPGPGSDEELTGRIRERARELPIPGACLVKRLESMHEFMSPGLPCGPSLAPLPLHSWEDDLTGRLAIVTQSSPHVWLRSKSPILSRIHPDYAHMAILLPGDLSGLPIRDIPPRRLREVARAND